MKVEVKKVNATKREMKFAIPKDKVSQKFDEVYQDLCKVAKIKGYRQGKVPRHILESQHANLAKEEVLKQIIPEAYQEAIQSENITPIDLPEIEDVSLKDGQVTFTAKLDIKPDVKIKDYKEIKVKRKSSQVTDEEMTKTLEYFAKAQSKDKEMAIDDAFARGLGFPNLEEFKKSLSRQMEMDKERHNRIDLENQIVEDLLKKAKLAVPETLVKKQLERRMTEWQDRMKANKVPEEEIQKKRDEVHKDLATAVEKDLKVYLILDKIAQLEKIEIKENDNLPLKVIEFLLKEAKWEGDQ